MPLETIILYLIIAAVLIGLPAFLAKKTGVNPMELIFGDRVNQTPFRKKEEESSDAKPAPRKETNSSRNDLLNLISQLATYARRNHFRLIVPGTLSDNGTTAVLTALLLTRSRVVGINCFGFGGSVQAQPGDADWQQTMNGEKTTFPSPVKKNRQQREIVQNILKETGWPDADVEIIGVFTSPSVRLHQVSKTNCYSKDGFLTYLQNSRFLNDRGLDPKKLEEALEPKILRAKGS